MTITRYRTFKRAAGDAPDGAPHEGRVSAGHLGMASDDTCRRMFPPDLGWVETTPSSWWARWLTDEVSTARWLDWLRAVSLVFGYAILRVTLHAVA